MNEKIYAHDIYPHVVHICKTCDKKCIKEKGEGHECLRSNFVGEIVVKVGGIHGHTSDIIGE